MTMHRSWTEIRQHFASIALDAPVLDGLRSLVDHVSESPLAAELYPWTSMFDLYISHTPPSPTLHFPHSRISAQQSGQLEFRYVDSPVPAKQWSRTVAPEDAIGRFASFISQLHWLVKAS